MRIVEVNVSAEAATPKIIEIGFAGEHNATEIHFMLDSAVVAKIDHYRASIGNYQSEKLSAVNGKIVLPLPQAAMSQGTVYIQLEGYAFSGDAPSLIFKSPVVMATVSASVGANRELPSAAKEPFETALHELKNLVGRAVELTAEGDAILEEVTNKCELSESAARVSNTAAETATNQRELAESAKSSAESAAERAEEYATAAAGNSASAGGAAATASMAARDAQSYADDARSVFNEAIATIDIEVENAKAYKNTAYEHSETARLYAEKTEGYKNEVSEQVAVAEGYKNEAALSADRLATVSDEELIIYPTIYNNDAPDWVEHDYSNVDPYSQGKDLYFKADIKQGKTYLVRVYIEHQEGYGSPFIMLTKKNSEDAADRIDYYKRAVYNEAVGCYQAEFTAKRNTEKGEELMLFVGYPDAGSPGYDYSAVFGGARIYIKDSLRGVIDSQNEEIAQIGGDIETALDGIIAIQNELIGGDEE